MKMPKPSDRRPAGGRGGGGNRPAPGRNPLPPPSISGPALPAASSVRSPCGRDLFSDVAACRPLAFPETLNWQNFVTAFQMANLGHHFIVSVLLTTASVAIVMVFGILAAYSFSRLKYRGKNILFSLFFFPFLAFLFFFFFLFFFLYFKSFKSFLSFLFFLSFSKSFFFFNVCF